MADVDELVTWLREQIAEDRKIAEETARMWAPEPPVYEWDTKVARLEDAGWEPQEVATLDRHVVRWDPAAVLAQCDAHEALLTSIFAYEYKIDGEWGCCHKPESIEAGRCPATNPSEIPAVRALALAYQHRPGYREEWRP